MYSTAPDYYLDYYDIVYHLPEAYHRPSRSNIKDPYGEKLGSKSLYDRRKSRCILQFYRIVDHATQATSLTNHPQIGI